MVFYGNLSAFDSAFENCSKTTSTSVH